MRLDHLLSRERARKRKRKRRRPEVERGGGKTPKREKEGERKRAGAAESAAGQSRNLAEDLYRFQGPPETHLENRTTQRSEEGKEEVRIDPGKGSDSGEGERPGTGEKADQSGRRGLRIEESDQARKGTGRMPRRHLPKKDAASCEKPRGAASGH